MNFHSVSSLILLLILMSDHPSLSQAQSTFLAPDLEPSKLLPTLNHQLRIVNLTTSALQSLNISQSQIELIVGILGTYIEKNQIETSSTTTNSSCRTEHKQMRTFFEQLLLDQESLLLNPQSEDLSKVQEAAKTLNGTIKTLFTTTTTSSFAAFDDILSSISCQDNQPQTKSLNESNADQRTLEQGGCSVLPLTLSNLQNIYKSQSDTSTLQNYLDSLNAALSSSGISSCLQVSAFLAQVAQETTELSYMTELGDGARYEGLCADLGNCETGDGSRFKGRGGLQLTGRNNYKAAGAALGVEFLDSPDMVAGNSYCFKTAAWFWNGNSLNSNADLNTEDGFEKITLKINGCVSCAWTHHSQRAKYWERAKEELGC